MPNKKVNEGRVLHFTQINRFNSDPDSIVTKCLMAKINPGKLHVKILINICILFDLKRFARNPCTVLKGL